MKIEIRKLHNDMTGPNEFAIVSEQRLIEMGYVYVFWTYNERGECMRVGTSKITTEAELTAYIESGMTRMEWEAMHGTD